MKNKKIYNRIDADEEMTDAEKREAYFAEIENNEADREE